MNGCTTSHYRQAGRTGWRLRGLAGLELPAVELGYTYVEWTSVFLAPQSKELLR